MKRFLSILLAGAMIMGICSFTSMAADISKTGYFEDFEGENASFTPNVNYVGTEFESGMTEHGKILRMANLKTTDNGGSYPASSDADLAIVLDKEYTADKVALSFDLYPHQTTQAMHVMLNDYLAPVSGDKAAYTLYLTADGKIGFSEDGTWHYGNLTCTTPYTANKWLHADLIMNFKERKFDVYVDGAFKGTANLADERLAFGKIKSVGFKMQNTYNQGEGKGDAKIDIDNVRISYISDKSFYMTAKHGRNYADIVFSETVKNINDVEVSSLKNVGTGKEVEITSVKAIGTTAVRVFFDEELAFGEEYRLTVAGTVESVVSNVLKANEVCFSANEYDGETALFADGDYNAPVAKLFIGNNEVTDKAQISQYVYYGDYKNSKALTIKGDSQSNVTVQYMLPKATTAKKVKLSYDLYAAQTGQSFTQMANHWLGGGAGSGESGTAPAYGVTLDNKTSFCISNNANSEWSKWPQYSANDKNSVEVIYDFEKRTVTTNISNSINAAFSYSGTIHNAILTSGGIKSVLFRVVNGNIPGTTTSAGSNPENSVFYIDNLKITEYNEETVVYEENCENNADLPVVYFGNDKATAETAAQYVSYENLGDSHGNVLALRLNTTANTQASFVLPQKTMGEKIKVSYDIRTEQTNQAFEQLFNTWYGGYNAEDNNVAPATGIMLNHQNCFGIDVDATNPWVGNDNSKAKFPQYKEKTWYNVEIEYDFTARSVKTYIDNKLITSGTIDAERLKSNSIKSVSFVARGGNLPGVAANVASGNNTGNEKFYIDNLKIIDLSEKTCVKSVEFTDCNGEYTAPGEKINPAVRGFKVRFSEDIASAGKIKLLKDGEAIDVDANYENGVYTAVLKDNSLLEANAEYTLSVTDATTCPYAYNFTTKEGKREVLGFDAVKNGANIDVTLKIANTTAVDAEATVSYGAYNTAFEMTGFDYNSDINAQSGKLYENTIPLAIGAKVSANDEIKVFLWENFENLYPITEEITVK